MRKIVLLMVMLLVLSGGCSDSVPIPRPGQLLYITTFDSFNEDWQLYEGELSVQIHTENNNPVLQISVDAIQDGAFTVMEQAFSDFDLAVDVMQVAGSEDQDAPGFGVLFRHKDNDNFYTFLISGDGYYQVRRRLDGVDEDLSDWAQTDTIALGNGAANQIRVIGQGDTFTFFVNEVQLPLCLTIWNPLAPGECQMPAGNSGEQPVFSADGVVMQLVDASFSQGRIGLGARTFEQSGALVSFDNLLICGPGEIVTFPYRCEEASP